MFLTTCSREIENENVIGVALMGSDIVDNNIFKCDYSNLEFQLFICKNLCKFDWLVSANR